MMVAQDIPDTKRLSRRQYSPDCVRAIVRTCGERTTAAACSILRECGMEVDCVSEVPFERALRVSYELAVENAATWTAIVDADMLVHPEAFDSLLRAALGSPNNVFQIQAPVLCKLFGEPRFGLRLYRTVHLGRALSLMPEPGSELRPEAVTVGRMRKQGFETGCIKQVVALHDFEQWNRDIYRKAFLHGQKHTAFLSKLIPMWRTGAKNDSDFRIALRGVYDGLTSFERASLDGTVWDELQKRALDDLVLEEKPPYAEDAICCDDVVRMIAEHPAGRKVPATPASGWEEPWQSRLRQLTREIGFIRTVPYLGGSALCQIGERIKGFVAAGRCQTFGERTPRASCKTDGPTPTDS